MAPRASKAIYRRRRAAVFLLVVTIALIIWGAVSCTSRGAGDAADVSGSTASSSPTPDASASPSDAAAAGASASPSADPSTDNVAECVAGDLDVSVKTGRSSYSFREQPEITYQIANISKVPCRANVGTSQQQLVVGSGPAEVWKLQACVTNPSDTWQVLQPSEPVSATVPWDLSFNDGTECTKTRRATVAGTYWVQASIGTASSSQYSFVLQ